MGASENALTEREALKREKAGIEARLADIEKRMTEIEVFLNLFDEFSAPSPAAAKAVTRAAKRVSQPKVKPRSPAPTVKPHTSTPGRTPAGVSQQEFEEAMASIIREAGKPQSSAELWQAATVRGLKLGGTNVRNNFRTKLYKAARQSLTLGTDKRYSLSAASRARGSESAG